MLKFALLFCCLIAAMAAKAQTENTFEAYERVQKYAAANDSANASKYLQDVNPYYLFYLHQTPEKLDSFFKRYKITSEGRKLYRPAFERAYSESKSALYDTLQAMQRDYMKLRYSLDTCKPSSEDYYLRKLQEADTPRFHFVYNYVQEHGWPSIEDGSLYAGAIALRDYIHDDEMRFQLKAAIEADKLPGAHKQEVSLLSGQKYLYELLKHDYKEFDISSFLAYETPLNSEEILAEIKNICPAKKIQAVYFAKNIVKGKNLMNDQQYKAFFKYFDPFWDAVEQMCASASDPSTPDISIYYQKRKQEKLVLYIIK